MDVGYLHASALSETSLGIPANPSLFYPSPSLVAKIRAMVGRRTSSSWANVKMPAPRAGADGSLFIRHSKQRLVYRRARCTRFPAI